MTDKISALTARLHADGFDSAQIAPLQDAFTYMDCVQRRFAHNPEPPRALQRHRAGFRRGGGGD